MAQNRFYSSVAQKTSLNGAISNAATSITVNAVAGFPISYPYTLILERDTVNEEVVTVTGASSLTLTVIRGADGTTAVAHTNGATVEHGVSARDYNEPQVHIAASQNIHGLGAASSVVGTTDAQTLTNKTLSAPTVTGTTTFPGTSTVDSTGQALFLKPYFFGLNNGASIPNAAWTNISYASYTQQGFAYAGGGSARVSAPVTGKYRVTAGGTWTLNATGSRGIQIRKNSGGVVSGGSQIAISGCGASPAGGSDVNMGVPCGSIVSLAAGDYVELWVYQDSTATLSMVDVHLEIDLVSI